MCVCVCACECLCRWKTAGAWKHLNVRVSPLCWCITSCNVSVKHIDRCSYICQYYWPWVWEWGQSFCQGEATVLSMKTWSGGDHREVYQSIKNHLSHVWLEIDPCAFFFKCTYIVTYLICNNLLVDANWEVGVETKMRNLCINKNLTLF